MKLHPDQIGELLALKRHERPPEGYMDDFLREFHHRQRTEAVSGGWVSRLRNRLSSWVGDRSAPRWAYGAGMLYAVVLAIFVLAPRQREVLPPVLEQASYPTVVSEEEAPEPLQQLEELDLRPSAEGEIGEQEF